DVADFAPGSVPPRDRFERSAVDGQLVLDSMLHDAQCMMRFGGGQDPGDVRRFQSQLWRDPQAENGNVPRRIRSDDVQVDSAPEVSIAGGRFGRLRLESIVEE